MRRPQPTLCAMIASLVGTRLVAYPASSNKAEARLPSSLSGIAENQRDKDLLLSDVWRSSRKELFGSGTCGPSSKSCPANNNENAREKLVISVHVRHTDKHIEAQRIPFSEYIHQADRIRMVQGIKADTIFLSTDSEEIARLAATEPALKRWNIILLDEVRARDNQKNLHNHLMHQNLNEEHARGVFGNIFLATQCDFFIGTLASNFGWVLDVLRQTNGGMNAGYVTFSLSQHVHSHERWELPTLPEQVTVTFLNRLRKNTVYVYWLNLRNREYVSQGHIQAGQNLTIRSRRGESFAALLVSPQVHTPRTLEKESKTPMQRFKVGNNKYPEYIRLGLGKGQREPEEEAHQDFEIRCQKINATGICEKLHQT